MKIFLLAPLLALLALIPGDSSGFPAGARPAPRPAPAPVRTPSFSTPRPAPAYRPPAPAYHPPAPAPRPAPRPVAPPAARPAFVPQQRPANIGGNTVNRPNISGNTVNRSNISGNTVNRPVISGNTVNRPNISGNTVNRANINNANVNRNVNVNRALVNTGINVNRPNGVYRPGYAYYHNYYGSWHHGYWNNWNYRPWLWGGLGLTTGLILGSTPPDVVYVNPYYDVPGPNVVPVYDYSQPIAVPQPVQVDGYTDDAPPPEPAVVQPPSEPTDDNSAAAVNSLNEARDAFMKKDYDKAQQAIDKAIQLLPNDTTLHEFRALVLFARRDYREAAAAIYAVLAVGPGWDWDTLRTLYPDVQTYTEQLRALENFCKADPTSASGRFLLAYHYLILDEREAAIRMLKSVVKLQPTNELAAYLLKSLEKPVGADHPAPAMPPM